MKTTTKIVLSLLFLLPVSLDLYASGRHHIPHYGIFRWISNWIDYKIENGFAQRTTDDLSEGASNFYWTDARFNTAFSNKSSDDLSEGLVNLYWTSTRFDAALQSKTTDNIAEGATNLYWTDARFDTALQAKTTDDLAEGTNNSYSQWSNSTSTNDSGATSFDVVYNTGNVGIGTSFADEQLVVDGIIRIRAASNEDNNSPGIVAQSNDDFLYEGFYYNHYGFGFANFTDDGTNNAFSTYLSGYAGVNIFAGGAHRIRIAQNGYIGLSVARPNFPLELANGAYVSPGGAWTDASSIAYKADVSNLSLQAAQQTLKELNPVTFRYKANLDESHVGFIAEEVPELVATQNRKGLSPMDIVAVLTKVVQDQQAQIEKLTEEINRLK